MNLDLSAIRSFVTAVELQGFARAAQKLHRTPGAISLQMKALEERVGCELFEKSGRQQILTPAGELLLSYARRLLQTNDEALLAMTALGMDGEVRFGMPEDFANGWLSSALAQFARAHPAVNIGIRVARSAELANKIQLGELDLALVFGSATSHEARRLGPCTVHWLAMPEFSWSRENVLPLLLLEQPCTFRQAAIDALDRAGIRWRVAMSSASVSAVWAAAEAGLGVTARTRTHAPASMVDVGGRLKLPAMKATSLYLIEGGNSTSAAARHLSSMVEASFSDQEGSNVR